MTNVRLRQHPRFDTRLFAQLESDEQCTDGLILDISASGCQFRTAPDQSLPLNGRPLTLVLPLAEPGKAATRIPALVRNRHTGPDGTRYGLQFTGSVDAVMKLLMPEPIPSATD
ncbi:PilZ domain-containing protein [Ferrimonas balearica]|uniref:PilZ domain-containing protein n=1 Tax=Ferrimonas balearica TaxID=44012 RepID=UPI001C9A229A|nr:PilZ domain-containing protein [Ferrimonas balearica]MBY5990814.1 PilZ domain-containing protein [Ferrimonas balearica]